MFQSELCALLKIYLRNFVLFRGLIDKYDNLITQKITTKHPPECDFCQNILHARYDMTGPMHCTWATSLVEVFRSHPVYEVF